MPNYPIRRQQLIPIACCVLHNFIRREARRDGLFEQFQVEDLDVVDQEEVGDSQQIPDIDMSQSSLNQMGAIRDDIAGRMWLDYRNRG